MPTVSVIVPCYNEQATIKYLLEALYRQTYPRAEMEVVIADGFSTDLTRQEIATFQRDCPDLSIRLIDNPGRKIPAAVNGAVAAARGEVIVRIDAHSIPYPEYIERCVKNLEQGKGQNVGGVWEIRPSGKGKLAQAIALAAAHPLAVGDAYYRHTSIPQAVDTVPFGAFRRELFERIGGLDETLATNEDYEFNVRVRKSGGTVWLDPGIRCVYYARGSLGALARQYWRYGFWKARMLLRYPGSLRWRQGLPPLFIASFLGLGLLSIPFPLARILLEFELAIYLLTISSVGLRMAFKYKEPFFLAGIPLAIGTMHISWGSAFLWSLLVSLTSKLHAD